MIFSRFQEASALLPGCPTLIHEGISTEGYAMNTARKFEAFLGKGDIQYGVQLSTTTLHPVDNSPDQENVDLAWRQIMAGGQETALR